MGCHNLYNEIVSEFLDEKLALFLQRFSISYLKEDKRIEYTITDRQSHEEVSFSVVLLNNTFARQIHISKFYPGLYRLTDCRFLSAACFQFIIHHFAQQFALGIDYSIFLQCRQNIFIDFYSTLQDFSFHILHEGQGENVDVMSPYFPVEIDTSMIKPCPTADLLGSF
ncbi:MAG: hypothetical protein OEM01_08965 [Desulfobulbaceae bacterium]|nr:hypothetical protein [Desulfobulbaceae bacterium]